MKNSNIVLTDDHTLFRNGLKMLLRGYEGFKIVGEASNGNELLRILATTPVDIVLLDISMPEMDGIEAAGIIMKNYPEVQIITLSMFGEEDYYFKMVSLGVKGFLLKNSSIDEVVLGIRTVAEGGSYFSGELLSSLVDSLQYAHSNQTEEEDDNTLSLREKEILFQICKGLSNQEIGEKLFISKRTVDKHRANILAKTSCKNTANLVVYAIKNGLVEI
ncbi:MAG: response regulator transcription factor [Rikenellaceae bacterium]